tara:strand:- start:279 stop:425 length:147 start_codon:yes stop_codon:yes gene_type:complete
MGLALRNCRPILSAIGKNLAVINIFPPSLPLKVSLGVLLDQLSIVGRN